MIKYYLEGFDEDCLLQCTFITNSMKQALEVAKKMYEEQDVETVFLNYLEDEKVIMVEVIDDKCRY